MGLKSNRKGKAGEREAATYLRELGFCDARRRQQSSGFAAAEVECPESLPNIHFEIKCGYKSGLGVGLTVLRSACIQAFEDCHKKEWAVLWREFGSHAWKLTYASSNGIGESTVAGDRIIFVTLQWMNRTFV